MSELAFQHCPLRVNDIPAGWELTALSAFVTEVQTGFASGDHNSDGQGVPHLRPMNITPNGAIDLTDLRSVAPEANTLRLRRGDVLFNNTNSPVWVGKTAYIDTDIELAFSNHMTRIRAPEEIDARFLAKQIHFLCTSGYFQYQCKKHVNQASINRSFLAESTPFLLPPPGEQRRITTKIEALQERSRKAREALEEVGPLLEQFRQSLLAAAFRGDLTADWRAANPNVEPASELLTRIRQERRQKWERSELAKFEAKGKQPPKDWQQRYQEPEPNDNLALPDVPASWCWCALEELATHQSGYAFQSKQFSTDGIQVVKLGNLYQGRFDLSRDPAYLPVDHVDAEAVRVLDGDILVSQTGTRYKRDYGFFVLVPPGSEPLLLNQRVLAVRPVRPTLSEWFVYSSQLDCYRDYFFSTETGGVNQGNVGVGGIMRGPIPLAPEKEIAEISRRLADAYASINEIVVSCSASETELSQLDQTILTKAFRGELVTQDPNDEPASELLARIRRMRDAVDDQTNSKARKASKNTRKKCTSK